MLGPVTPREQGRLCSVDPGLAAASRELVERALADGLHGIEGWLDMGQVGDDVDELLCAVWRGDEVTGPLMAGGARAKVCKRLSRKLDDRAICPSGAVGTVVALWPPRQVSAAPPGSACDQGF